jgi:hypothetical protein
LRAFAKNTETPRPLFRLFDKHSHLAGLSRSIGTGSYGDGFGSRCNG